MPPIDRGRQAHGAFGEDLVARWYEARGYEIVARNWRSGRTGEIDLVATAAHVLVFCEVKARTNDTFGSPFEAVTAAKQARIRRLAVQWLAEAGDGLGRRQIRFDVAAVLSGKVEVVEGAF